MNQTEMEQRNLISTITECLQEHEVQLTTTDNETTTPRYLIEVPVQSNVLQDFLDTYKGDLSEFNKKIAKNILPKKETIQTLGVLVTPNLQYDFAFNRLFADLNKERTSIEFKDPEELILQASKKTSSNTTKPKESFQPKPSYRPRPHSGGAILRYSITGPKEDANQKENNSLVHEKPSLIDRIEKEYNSKTVKVKTEKKTELMYLISIEYQTQTALDFQRTYEGELDEFKAKLAQKTFGSRKVVNNYFLLHTPDLEIKFACNALFGEYDKGEKSFVYKSAEDVLLEQTKDKGVDYRKVAQSLGRKISDAIPRIPKRKKGGRRGRGGSMFPSGAVVRYSLQGKK